MADSFVGVEKGSLLLVAALGGVGYGSVREQNRGKTPEEAPPAASSETHRNAQPAA